MKSNNVIGFPGSSTNTALSEWNTMVRKDVEANATTARHIKKEMINERRREIIDRFVNEHFEVIYENFVMQEWGNIEPDLEDITFKKYFNFSCESMKASLYASMNLHHKLHEVLENANTQLEE